MPSQSHHQTASPIAVWMWRLVWLGMLVLHARPLANAIASGDTVTSEANLSPLRAIVLILSSIFFVLKIVDVRWLRFRTDFCATVSWLVVVSLLHLGPIQRSELATKSLVGTGIVFALAGSIGFVSTRIARLYQSIAKRSSSRRVVFEHFGPAFMGVIRPPGRHHTYTTAPRGPPSFSPFFA